VLADTETHGELGRVVNALSSADEFKEHGDEVSIIFDGAGVRWAAELSNPDHRLHERFERLRDKVAGACHYCAGAFEVRDQLEQCVTSSSRSASRSFVTTKGIQASAGSCTTATR
jgi:hypothetical protein